MKLRIFHLLVTLYVIQTNFIPTAQAEPIASKVVRHFDELRTELINMISEATTRVWLSSNFLSDGDLVSALYIAKYRKLDVHVLLGRKKAANYMSRLRFLKTQSIPVFLMPANFPQYGQSALLVDEKFISINSELDFMVKKKGFTITYGNSSRSSAYMGAFANATNLTKPSPTKPVRLAKRKKSQQIRFHRAKAEKNKPTQTIKKREDTNQTYYYSGPSPKRPETVPVKLPAKTLWQLKLEKQFDKQEKETTIENDDTLNN
ncbi:MAG: hypothetical protein R3B45_13660 [Bdellovibrionota bacterium]